MARQHGMIASGRIQLWALSCLIGLSAWPLATTTQGDSRLSRPEQFFHDKVRPILAKHCFECHSQKQISGLRLDSRPAALTGGISGGKAIVPGKPEESLVVDYIKYDPFSVQMPPTGKLSQEKIDTIAKWVEMGAPWDNNETDPGPSTVRVFFATDRAPLSAQEAHRSRLWWPTLAACCGLVTTLLGLVGSWRRWTAPWRFSVVLLLLVTLGMTGYATLDWLSTQGRYPRARRYGSQRGKLEMGVCDVSIPPQHQPGQLEAPSIWRLELQEDVQEHVVLVSTEIREPEEYFAQMQVVAEASERQEAFVFVHGYNVTFEDAARRTAQMTYDLKFDGVPIFYSWPSRGELLGYTADENNAEWTVPHLKDFLVQVADRSGAKSVHLVAHSMGNRALTGALRQIRYQYRDRLPMFQEVVLTAPDIDAEIFRRDIAPAVTHTASRVTLYASSNDGALKASKKVHGGYPRAGDSQPMAVVLPGVETVDVSAVDTSLVGHNYYGENSTVLADLIDLINKAQAAHQRPWLSARQHSSGLTYWHFDPTRLRDDSPTNAPTQQITTSPDPSDRPLRR